MDDLDPPHQGRRQRPLALPDGQRFHRCRQREGGARPTTTRISYADIFPDGRILPNPAIQSRGSPAFLFPQLPATAAEAKAGWKSAAGDAVTTCKPIGDRFESRTVGLLDKVYLHTSKSICTFDGVRALISKIECENSMTYPFKGNGTSLTELTGERTLPAAELSQLASDADRYIGATATYEEALLTAARKLDPAKAKESLAKALEKLEKAVGPLSQADLKKSLIEKVEDHAKGAKSILEYAECRSKVIGKAAYAFDVKDLHGRSVTLEGLRGKVVVLDFWYRGCGGCIRTLPQMNGLAADFAGAPVAILGMNTDGEKADADFVAKEINLKYDTLRIGDDLAERFGVRGYPTLVVIDKKGILRELHAGYSHTLREDLGRMIRALLAEE